jgi:hypothetical protein
MIVFALACVIPASAAEITELKALHPRTELVVGGEPRCVIVVPDDADLRAQAEALASALPAAPEIVLDTATVSPQWDLDLEAIAGRNLIALGNINNARHALRRDLRGRRLDLPRTGRPRHPHRA